MHHHHILVVYFIEEVTYVIPNLYESLSSVEHERIVKNTVKVSGVPNINCMDKTVY